MSRVLLVHQPVDGGVGRHVADLARGLSARNHDVLLCGPNRPIGLDERFQHLPLDMQRSVSLRDLAAVVRLARIVRQTRPDLIHAHSSKAGAVARLGRTLNPSVPVIYTPHGYAFNGHFSRELERRAYREIERVLARMTTRVVCVCEAEAALARSIGSPDRVRVVHNGIEIDTDHAIDADMSALGQHGGPVICALTQLRPGKGLEALIDAMPTVLAGHPTAQLAIVGDGPDLAALRDRARASGVVDSVHFLGERREPLTTLRGGDIFVHPSLAEAFPYVILEAMAASLPIIASRVGGIPEAIVDGESGMLVASGSVPELADRLDQLLANPQRRAKLGRAARDRVQRCFSKAQMVSRMLSIYDELL